MSKNFLLLGSKSDAKKAVTLASLSFRLVLLFAKQKKSAVRSQSTRDKPGEELQLQPIVGDGSYND